MVIIQQHQSGAGIHCTQPEALPDRAINLFGAADSRRREKEGVLGRSSRSQVEALEDRRLPSHHLKRGLSRSEGSAPLSKPNSSSSKRPRTREHERIQDAQIVHFSSPRLPVVHFLPRQDGEVKTIRFQGSEQECLFLARGFPDSFKPEGAQLSYTAPTDENIAILPVGGPDSGIVSPYTYSLDKPLTITVSSGVLKGLGMFAKRSIRQGSVILVERPVMIVEEVEDAELVFKQLNKNVKRYLDCLTDSTVSGKQNKTAKGILATNAFNIELAPNLLSEKKICKAIFLQSSQCNHSCGPSAIATFNASSWTLTLHANRDLRPGDEITVSYLPVSLPSAASIPLISSPPTSPPATLGHFRPTSPSGVSSVSASTSASSSTISNLLSSSSLYDSSDIPAIYLARHSRRAILYNSYNFECRCEHCDIPWSEADGVHKSDRIRKELGLYNVIFSKPSSTKLRKRLAIPTFEEWCGDSRFPVDSLIKIHKRLLEMREKEGLELIGLANPIVSGAQGGNLKEEGWLKHADILGMCYGALGDKVEFRRWVGRARDLRWAMSNKDHGASGTLEQTEHVKVLDAWLDEPKSFPLWGWRAQKKGQRF